MPKVGRMVKESSIEELNAQLAERPNFFVAAVNRLPAAETNVFRQKLYASKASLVVVKRRLGLRALQPLNIAGLGELLAGSIGLVLIGDDPVITAKTLEEFRKANEEKLAIRGGLVDGQLLNPDGFKQLAALPSKPVLLAQVIGTIESPIASVIMTLERLIGDLIRGVDQLATKRESEAAAAASTPPPTPSAPASPESGPAAAPGNP